jgi:formate C-acetyltransferase
VVRDLLYYDVHKFYLVQIISTRRTQMSNEYWNDFKEGKWTESIDIADFIKKNISPYEGDHTFLEKATPETDSLWEQLSGLMKEERQKGILDAETTIPTGVDAHDPGYIDKAKEKIVGLQTEAPLKRAIMPNGGIKLVKNSLAAYGYELDPITESIFTDYRKTHNDGVFDAYTPAMRAARSSGIITGLPDNYGRGRIIGDYRRVALYGVDRLIAQKKIEKEQILLVGNVSDAIRDREEVSEQIKSLLELKSMAARYGFDISVPAKNATEAIQWTYLAYLGAIKQQNGAAMSLGRVSTFFDIYIERDLKAGAITESEAQELVDHFVMKLRIVRFLRTPEYDDLFSGDPVWVTESIGGMSADGDLFVTKNSFRFLHTLYNLGPAPEPNLTVLWSEKLPVNFKNYCSKVSIDTSSIQYESDQQMKDKYGDDFGVACCVSGMGVGKEMQFFGARANLAKLLLYSLNGGRDEISGKQVGPKIEIYPDEVLEIDKVMARFEEYMDWLAELYVNSLNVIHFMHDKYCYESLQMSLHDTFIKRNLACGVAGLSVVADSLSSIKTGQVKVVRNEDGLITDFEGIGDYPAFGNSNPEVDDVAGKLVEKFMNKIRVQPMYRNARPTLSVLTITSNVVYGKKTGNTPDGRRKGEPFAPGANPMHNRDTKGAVASMHSVASLPYEHAEDGISYTFTIIPEALGKDEVERTNNMTQLLDGYFVDGGQHINVNVLQKEMLEDAMENPENYPQLTIRVSGYAVNFIKLTKEQKLDVINRTFHSINY